MPMLPPQDPASELSPATLMPTLARYGITPARGETAASAAEAANAAQRIGFPVALKIASRDVPHKTEVGGVALDLRDRTAVEAAADMLVERARAALPQARIDGFLVQEMTTGIEAIVGARSDPLYGPMLLIGAGGILVELADDTQIRLLPVTAGDVTAMIERLKLAKLIGGFRGRPAADRPALKAAALALARFFLDHRANLSEIEINPLMLRTAGNGAVAVDVRVVWRDTA
jgi:succinyl-CoA synthetase beta subunit